jgi:hypothetical protein
MPASLTIEDEPELTTSIDIPASPMDQDEPMQSFLIDDLAPASPILEERITSLENPSFAPASPPPRDEPMNTPASPTPSILSLVSNSGTRHRRSHRSSSPETSGHCSSVDPGFDQPPSIPGHPPGLNFGFKLTARSIIYLHPGCEPWIKPPPIAPYPGSKKWTSFTLAMFEGLYVLEYCSADTAMSMDYRYFDRIERIRLGFDSPLLAPPGCLDIIRFGIPFPRLKTYSMLHPTAASSRGSWLYLQEHPRPGDVDRVMDQPGAGLPYSPARPQIAVLHADQLSDDDDDDFWASSDHYHGDWRLTIYIEYRHGAHVRGKFIY